MGNLEDRVFIQLNPIKLFYRSTSRDMEDILGMDLAVAQVGRCSSEAWLISGLAGRGCRPRWTRPEVRIRAGETRNTIFKERWQRW